MCSESVLKCVKQISRTDCGDSVPNELETVSSALTLMINCAKLVEQATMGKEGVGQLRIMLCVKAHRPQTCPRILTSPSASGAWTSLPPFEMIGLWGPNISNLVEDDNEEGRRPDNEAEGHIESQAVNGTQGSLIQRRLPHDESATDEDNRDCNQDASGAITGMERSPTGELGQNPGSKAVNCFEIREEISAMCTSFLLDGAGHTAHCNTMKEYGFSDLHVNELITCVKNMMDIFDEVESSRRCGIENTGPDTETQVGPGYGGTAAGKQQLLYTSLIPDELREKTVSVPLARFRRSCYQQKQVLKVSNFEVYANADAFMNIRKPDRNSKIQNFSILCINLQIFGKEGIAGKALLNFARKGLLYAESCRLWKQHTKAARVRGDYVLAGELVGMGTSSIRRETQRTYVSACGGPLHCEWKARSTCSFISRANGETEVLGEGTVHPRITYLMGGRVPPDCFVVRFAQMAPNVGTAHSDALKNCDSQVVLWKRDCVKRVCVKGPYSASIGTAVLVSKKPWERDQLAQSRGRKRKRTGAAAESSTQISRAVVLCDIRLNGAGVEVMPYPYAEWYDLASVKPLIPLHFANKIVPSSLKDTTREEVTEILWDSRMIEEE